MTWEGGGRKNSHSIDQGGLGFWVGGGGRGTVRGEVSPCECAGSTVVGGLCPPDSDLCPYADLLIDFDMDVYEVNETDGLLLVEVELTSMIEREIRLLLVTRDGRATG